MSSLWSGVTDGIDPILMQLDQGKLPIRCPGRTEDGNSGARFHLAPLDFFTRGCWWRGRDGAHNKLYYLKRKRKRKRKRKQKWKREIEKERKRKREKERENDRKTEREKDKKKKRETHTSQPIYEQFMSSLWSSHDPSTAPLKFRGATGYWRFLYEWLMKAYPNQQS